LSRGSYYQGEFHRWTGTHYEPVPGDEMHASVRGYLADASHMSKSKDGNLQAVPFEPNRSTVAEVMSALQDATIVPASQGAPRWLSRPHTNARTTVTFRNGLLDTSMGNFFIPPSTDWFTLNALPFDHDPDAPAPERWLQFLAETWPGDQDSIDCLQEWFGLLLTPETKHHKLLLLIGQPRSGKSTITGVLHKLVGANNVCSPKLAQLGQQFGLASLIGKTVAMPPDARLGSSADKQGIVQTLLSVSGGDAVTIERKYLPDWHGTLPARFVITSNEIPQLGDASGALMSRTIVLETRHTIPEDKRDPDLPAKLEAELPGILNWALAGLRRLNTRGKLIQPEAGKAALADMEEASSPISVFLRERCVIGPEHSVERGELFTAWRVWCGDQHRDAVGTAQTFGVMLRAAVPGLTMAQPRKNGKQVRAYGGVGLAPEADDGADMSALMREPVTQAEAG
jgi:putative DNA primase/helicase